MKYNKSEIMKKAWQMKRRNLELFGDHETDYNRVNFKTFGQCLKDAWAEAKYQQKLAEMREANRAKREAEAAEKAAAQSKVVYIVPNWMMQEKALFGIRSNKITTADIERETVKAFKAHGEWFPKSVCERA